MNFSTKDDIRVRRVKISERDEQALKQIAERYGCIYNKKLSISSLLSQIADGRLKISKPELSFIKNKASNIPLVELEIEVLSNLNGILAEISAKISKFEGNIYKSKAVEHSKNSHIKMAISIPQSHNLAEIVKSLYSITIENVLEFNKEDKLEKLLEIIDINQYQRYKEHKKNNSINLKIKDFFHSSLIDYKSKKLVTNIVLIIGFQIVIDNQPGTLSKLAYKIAKKQISISSINIDFIPDQNQNLVNLFLGFGPVIDQVFQEIGNIQTFMRNLKNLDFVESVRQLNIDFMEDCEI